MRLLFAISLTNILALSLTCFVLFLPSSMRRWLWVCCVCVCGGTTSIESEFNTTVVRNRSMFAQLAPIVQERCRTVEELADLLVEYNVPVLGDITDFTDPLTALNHVFSTMETRVVFSTLDALDNLEVGLLATQLELKRTMSATESVWNAIYQKLRNHIQKMQMFSAYVVALVDNHGIRGPVPSDPIDDNMRAMVDGLEYIYLLSDPSPEELVWELVKARVPEPEVIRVIRRFEFERMEKLDHEHSKFLNELRLFEKLRRMLKTKQQSVEEQIEEVRVVKQRVNLTYV